MERDAERGPLTPQGPAVFLPRHGIGPIVLGSLAPTDGSLGRREEVAQLPVFRGSRWLYPDVGVQLHCGPSGDVLEVEAVEPLAVTYAGVMLLQRPLTHVVSDLGRLGYHLETSGDADAVSNALGLRLFADDGVVVSCTAFDPGRPLPVPSHNELLAAMGLPPID